MQPAFIFVILIILIVITRRLHVPLVISWHPCWVFWNVFVKCSGGGYIWFVSVNLLPRKVQYLMPSNGLDRQIIFLDTFFPIKYLIFFVSIVYWNSCLYNKVVPPAIYFCLSSISRLNSSTFFLIILVYFFEFHFMLNSLSAMDGRDRLLKN